LKEFGVLFLTLVSFLYLAVLPPLAESTREIQALMKDSHLHQILTSAEVVEQVIRTEGGYLVLTQKRLVPIDIEYHSQEKPGPLAFTFRVREPLFLSEPHR
jgi:hypothetical protein